MQIEAEVAKTKTTRFKPWMLYVVYMLVLVASAMMLVFQVFEYRQDYKHMSKLLNESDDLNAEWGRLLIEQQTFGATAQIGTRAVTTLQMYSPPIEQSVVIELPAAKQLP
jgi:cell division protein FtsL